MKTVIILKKYKISKAIATVCHRTDADKVLGYHKRQRAIELSQKRMTAHLVGILINGTLLIRFTNHVNLALLDLSFNCNAISLIVQPRKLYSIFCNNQ